MSNYSEPEIVTIMAGRGRGASLKAALEKKKKEEQEQEQHQAQGVEGPSPQVQKPMIRGRGQLLSLLRSKEASSKTTTRSSTPDSAVFSATTTAPATTSDASSTTVSDLHLARRGADPDSSGDKMTQSSSFSDKFAKMSVGPTQSDGAPIKYVGTAGRKMTFVANYVKLDVECAKGVVEYEVRFSPEIDYRNERFHCLYQHSELIGNTRSFDGGSKLFLPMRLPDEITTMTSTTQSGQEVTVKLRFRQVRLFGDPECVQLYNVLFRRIMATLKYCQMNKNFYNPRGSILIPQHKLEVWPGYVTAVDEYKGGLKLQCDVSHRVLRTETVRDLLVDLHQRKVANFKAEAEKQLLGSIILTRYNNKTYRIDEIDFEKNPMDCFSRSNGEKISYVDYYKQQYNLTIRDARQPLLMNRPRAKAQGEDNVSKLISLIPELCYLTGLTDTMRSDFKVMKDVGAHTRITPNQRNLALKKYVDSVYASPEATAVLAGWGLKMSSDPVKIEGRQMEPPILHYGRNESERVGPNADWSRAVTSKPVLTPVSVDKWLIVFPSRNKDVAQSFSRIFQQQAPRMGIQVSTPGVQSLDNDRTDTYLKAIRTSVTKDTQLVVTIFPQQRADRYAAIKKLCYVENPVASQVILAKTLSNEKRITSVVQKIILQINCKLGGELWASLSPVRGLMVIGIDVFHDPTLKGASIAGFVSSLNDKFSRWHSRVSVQRPGQELVDALRTALIEALKAYRRESGQWPTCIMVFRDGIGDSQIDTSATHEVGQLLTAFEHCEPGFRPKFGFIVVQKRINTRLYQQLNNGLENPPPGSVVDHTITRKSWYDFFLVSQKVGQGTVSPTHYVVVYDGKTLPPDLVQKVAYNLSHMYFNWPGTIRVPAPCQYAHKLAAMVGEHLHKEPSSALEDRLFYL